MTKDELLGLADRCEREEASHNLDKAILSALGYTWRGMAYWSRDDKHIWDGQANFTRSLDAAVTLVPEGDSVFWRLGHDGTGPDPSVFRAEVLVCLPGIPGAVGRALTPALALCAAALRARASLTEKE